MAGDFTKISQNCYVAPRLSPCPMTRNYPSQCPQDSGYCRKIRNHPARDSDIKWQQMRERALFR
jgi:hypothetical protein